MSDATATGLYAQMDLAPGTLLAGRFRIERLIGVGGMGVVYRAEDESLGVPVAIKLLRPEVAARADAFDRFRQELLLARQVSSPHVVRIHDIARHEFSSGDVRWLISMDLVDGEPLDHRIDRGALAIDDAVRIARDVALGLQAAHAREVVHRDLKPANILIDREGNAYISDFGVARSFAGSSRNATAGIVGTPDYLSPEQARGDPVGPRSDLYALGLILHEMLTGERAFAAATAAEALAQRLVRTPPLVTTFRPEVPQWLARLVERLLRPQPSHRLPDATAVVHAIDRREVPRGPMRRRSLLLGAGVAALLALAVGGIWWTQRAAHPVAAPAPSPPLDRLLLMPLDGRGVPADELAGIDTQLRYALASTPGVTLVDRERTWQALRQLDATGQPALSDMRRNGAATRVMRIRLSRDGAVWRAAGDFDGAQAAPHVQAAPAASAGAALSALLRLPASAGVLEASTAPSLALPASSTLAAQGAAEIARRDGHYDLALDGLRQATAGARSDAVGWMELADVAIAVGEEDTALDALDQAQRAAAAAPARFRQQLAAQRAMLEGDAPAAVQRWKALLAASPSDTGAELQLARAQGAAGDPAAAIGTLEHLASRDAQDARAWFLLGKFLILKGDARTAVDDHLLRALVLFKRSRNRYGEAEAVNALGVGYGRLGQTAEAEEQYRRAVTLRRVVGNRRGVATSLRNLANLLSQRGAFDEAAAALAQARATMIELGDRAGLAAVDNERGLLFEERGDYPASLEAFKLALQGSERAGDTHGVAQALNDIGFAHFQLGAYDDAQTYWQRAAETYRGLDDETGGIRTQQNLGLLDATRGRWESAQRRQSQALSKARERQMAEETAVGYRNLAELALWRGDIGGAIRQADSAVQQFSQRDDLRGSVDARLLRIDALLDAGSAGIAARDLAALKPDLAQASTEQQAIAGRLAAAIAAASGDVRGALAALRKAQPLAAASGVRGLQLELDLMRSRLGKSSPAAFDAPTAALGHARLRLQWIANAMDWAIAHHDAGTAIALYRESAGLLRGIAPPVASQIHTLAAAAYGLQGDAVAAADAEHAARAAHDVLVASIPASLGTAAPPATRTSP